LRDRLSAELIEALHELALLGGLRDRVAMNTTRLGQVLGVSQQSASRRMLELSRLGLVERGLSRRGQVVRITAKGEALLRERFRELQSVFEVEARVVLRGKVESGMGEGAYYMGMPHYQNQFAARLGAKMFAGTLNVRVTAEDVPSIGALRRDAGVLIDGFQKEGRTFGGATCFPASILIAEETREGSRGAQSTQGRASSPVWVISPHRTHYTEVIEIIAPFRLRDRLKLKDGAEVSVEVQVSADPKSK
jgi:riboflavin kinase